jgi:hypothetical protein
LDVTEPCSGVTLKKEEIADTVHTWVGGEIASLKELEFVPCEGHYLDVFLIDLELAVGGVNGGSPIQCPIAQNLS